MPINENMVQEIVQEVMAKMQIADAPTGKHGIFKEMNDAIEAAKKSQLIVKKMSMDQREKIITCIRKKIKENAEIEVNNKYVKLNTEKYGGMICSTWFDRPLSIAGRILVKENNGTWSLPGGWVDVDVSVHDNIIKEVKEESGLDVTVDTVIAIQDREKHNQPVYAWKVCKVFALCSVVGGSFEENIETSESRYFSEEEISKLKLAEEKNNIEQIHMCFEAARTPNWKTRID